MPPDTATAVAIARLEEKTSSLVGQVKEVLEVAKGIVEEQRTQMERLIRLEARFEHEIERLESRDDAVATEEPATELTVARVEESKARSGLWKVLTTMIGVVTGALGTWFAVKK